VKLVAWFLVLLIAAPLGIAAIGSILDEGHLYQREIFDLGAITIDHWRALLVERSFLRPVLSSLIVASGTTAISLLLASLAAYALARLPIRGKRVLLAALLAVSLLPQISIVSPLYLLLRELSLIDTYFGLVLSYLGLALPLAIWSLSGFFAAIPKELEEAAMVEGASRVRILTSIVLPLSLPGLATTAVLTFVAAWNELLFALAFTVSPEKQTVPVAVALFRGQYQVPWGQILAASVLASIPVAVLALSTQRRILAGLAQGAVKG
jgi:ABC-type glycerol-3-phosphate transport system permease component